MSVNVSGFGLSVTIVASVTFPQGFTITEFADDADPITNTEQDLTDSAMGLNGDHVMWSRPNLIEVVANVIARSADDVNLTVLAEANRTGKGKTSARDIITMTINYPDGMIASLTKGVIATAEMLPQVQNSGRLKGRPYRFRFENIAKSQLGAGS